MCHVTGLEGMIKLIGARLVEYGCAWKMRRQKIFRYVMILSVMSASAFITLACTGAGITNNNAQGLKDLFACRLETEAAEDVLLAYFSALRSKTIGTVGPNVSRQYSDILAKDFYRLNNDVSVFGVPVHGILFGGMHGLGFFIGLGEGDIQAAKRGIEHYSGLRLTKPDTPNGATYASPRKKFIHSVTLGPIEIPNGTEARSVLYLSEISPDYFQIGCVVEFNDGHHPRLTTD